MKQNRIVTMTLALTLGGCATYRMKVQSTPEGADVVLQSADGTQRRIGRTPLEVDTNDQRDLQSGSSVIRVSKEGFLPQNILLPRLASTGGEARLNFNLSETTLPKACTAKDEAMSEVAQGVAEAANFIQQRKLEEAAGLLQNLLTKYPTVSVLHDLQGNTLYLQQKFPQALAAYRKSNGLSPNNPRTARMIQKIERIQGSTKGEQQ